MKPFIYAALFTAASTTPLRVNMQDNCLGKACGGNEASPFHCGPLYVCSYEDAPFPVGPKAKGKCVKKTPTLKQKCEGRGLKACPQGYKCQHDVDPKKVADIPGTCVLQLPSSIGAVSSCTSTTIPSVPTPTGFPTMCGGIIGKECPIGFQCLYSDDNPYLADKSGYCHPESSVISKVPTDAVPTDAVPTGFPATCGGITGKECPTGFECIYSDNNPLLADKSGHCHPKSTTTTTSQVPTSAVPTGFPATCGGIAGKECPIGFQCLYSDDNPYLADKSGYCVPESIATSQVPTSALPTATLIA